MTWRRIGVVCGVMLLFAAWTSDASAHAVLLRAIPPTGQTIPSPSEVRLLFSEPLDPSFSAVQLLDPNGKPIDAGDSHVDKDDERQLVVSVPAALSDGVYVVSWRSLSAIDVHPDTGQYRLFVGVPALPSQSTQQLYTAESSSTPLTAVSRWWLYLSASVFAGALATWRLVIAPVLASEARATAVAAARVRRLAVAGGALLLVGSLFAAVAQAAAAANTPIGLDIGGPLGELLGRGRYAAIWWPRIGLSLIAVALVVFTGLDGLGSDSAMAIVPAILLTNSLTSHGAGLPFAGLGVAVDWVHIMGAAVWVGGLASLAVLFRAPLIADKDTQASLLSAIVKRFTRLALVAVLAIALSGTVQAVLEVGSWGDLLATTYGLAVVVKVLLLALMLLLAITNQRRGTRGLRVVRGVRAEFVLGVTVLAVAAVLTGIAPSRQVSATAISPARVAQDTPLAAK